MPDQTMSPDEMRDLWELLAAQYVLGTLSAATRRRFERQLQDDAWLREVTYGWERRLNPLTDTLQPQTVSPEVWQSIERRLGLAGSANIIDFSSATPKHTALLRRPLFWWSAASTAAAVVLLCLLLPFKALYLSHEQNQPLLAEQVHDVAVLTSKTDGASWIVRRQADTLMLSALNVQATPSRHDLELWSIHEHDHPRSLGVLHVVDGRVVVTHLNPDLIAHDVTLAISLEPAHGSPTGLPTGPVLYMGKIARI